MCFSGTRKTIRFENEELMKREKILYYNVHSDLQFVLIMKMTKITRYLTCTFFGSNIITD